MAPPKLTGRPKKLPQLPTVRPPPKVKRPRRYRTKNSRVSIDTDDTACAQTKVT